MPTILSTYNAAEHLYTPMSEVYTVFLYSVYGVVVKVLVVKMFNQGVEVERRMLNDRYTIKYEGDLVIMDATDSGRHRPIKVARLMTDTGIACELSDMHVVWSSDNRITFTGDERTGQERVRATGLL